MARNQQHGRSSGGRKVQGRRLNSVISMSIGDAIGTANAFGHLLTGENVNQELLSSMVYSNGATGSPKSNIDTFGKTGAKRLLGEDTVIKNGYATLYFEGSDGNIAACIRCRVLGHQMIGNWQVFTP